MIQPIKQFRVTRLTIRGFKGYADSRTFQFGNMNVISGHMGVGKSSIADAIAFATSACLTRKRSGLAWRWWS